ncbi:MAG: RsmD family RNA methyltransferase, partial [Bacteroidales bacterium]
MRIVSGKFKGRQLYAPTDLPVRPTTDLAKESLFNILR